jgi:hypothetical protein
VRTPVISRHDGFDFVCESVAGAPQGNALTGLGFVALIDATLKEIDALVILLILERS